MNTDNRMFENKTVIFSRIVLFVLMLLFLYLIVFTLLTSLKTTSEFYRNIWAIPRNIEINNYIIAWTRGEMGRLFFNSVFIVGTTVIFTLLFSSLSGYAIARLQLPFSKAILGLIVICTIPPSEAIFMPAYLIAHKITGNGNYISCIMPYTAWGLPLAIYIFYTFFKALPAELIESARLDGCGEIQTFWHVAAPLMLPATATISIMTFVGWWGDLLWASVNLSTSGLRTLPLGVITFSGVFGAEWGQLAAAINIVLMPLVILFIFTQKYFVRGLTGGAVKG